jgi:hypothetical protein
MLQPGHRERTDTMSYDVALQSGKPVYPWLAVFDHTLTRHSFHLHPLRIVLE